MTTVTSPVETVETVETTGQRLTPDAPTALLVCGECRFAQLYAIQPRAMCACPGAAFRGRVVFSGQPACDDAQPRRRDDLTLATRSLGARTPLTRFSRPRPHLY